MPIDWFTVVAQAINFLILVWLLKRFLYTPILRAIDEREKGIAAQLATAEAKVADAQQEREDFRLKNEDLDRQRAALLARAEAESDAERRRLLEEARKEADSLRAKRRDALRSEQRKLSGEITRWAQREVFAITRRTLTDLAATSLEERIAEVFVDRLRGLTGAARGELGAALRTPGHAARVRSAFELPQAQRDAIVDTIKESFASEIPVEFETAPEMLGGVELSAGGQKVAWSIADYLATLEKRAGELLYADAEPGPSSDAPSRPGSGADAGPGPKPQTRHGPEPAPSAARGVT